MRLMRVERGRERKNMRLVRVEERQKIEGTCE